MVRDPLDLRRYAKTEDGDDLTQALVEEIIEKCLGFEVEQRSLVWGQNLTLMYDRVLRYPDHVRNLYFTFLFVLRAVTKALDYLEQAEYDTGRECERVRSELPVDEDNRHQLQLQRNEVIALTNLLNRLSESFKFVHEVGPTVERIMEGGHFSAHTRTD
ncbi:Endoplasmic reticulum oxidoreductin-1 [Glycine max]|nr:Endoplasmic reticulum oxidoreductin-1 [Glycine max]KAH1241574.1 Endoplasmic reticulum oxidoreductin-1 [Glycine max]